MQIDLCPPPIVWVYNAPEGSPAGEVGRGFAITIRPPPATVMVKFVPDVGDMPIFKPAKPVETNLQC